MCVLCVCVCCVMLCVMLWGLSLLLRFICVGVLIICSLDVCMMYCVLVSGLCLCCVVGVRVGFNVFVRVVCDLLCGVV